MITQEVQTGVQETYSYNLQEPTCIRCMYLQGLWNLGAVLLTIQGSASAPESKA